MKTTYSHLKENLIFFQQFLLRPAEVSAVTPTSKALSHLLVDAIISGLPWSSFKISTQNRLLDVIEQALAPGGRFVTLAYSQGLLLSTGQAFRRALKQRFVNVHASKIIWENIPPGFVYYAEKSKT